MLEGETVSTLTLSDLNEKITVFPNPTSGLVHVQNNGLVSINTIAVYDAIGRLIYSAFPAHDAIQVSFSLAGNSSGIYTVVLSQAQTVLSKRIMFK